MNKETRIAEKCLDYFMGNSYVSAFPDYHVKFDGSIQDLAKIIKMAIESEAD